MATWVVPLERRKKPAAPKPDAAVAQATDTYYRNALSDVSGQDALRSATDWIRARRPHMEIEQ
jgi:hypothetical protein